MPQTKTAAKKPSSGSDPQSRAKVKDKMEAVMHEFKEGELQSGKSKKQVKNPKQAIAIGLSEARKAGANIPPPPAKKKASPKKAASSPSKASRQKSGK